MLVNNFKEQVQALPNTPELHLYILIDFAQDPQLLAALERVTPDTQSRCLLKDARDSEDLSKVAPHLATLPPYADDSKLWISLLRKGAEFPASFTLIASAWDLPTLHAHLEQFTEIILPDGEEKYFAFWDPAILGTLVGQKDDDTLYIPYPALSAPQRTKLLTGISAWWYWSRYGALQQIKDTDPQSVSDQVVLPLKLTPVQEEMLVEASVPDHLLGYIKENQPQLLMNLSAPEQYERIKKHLLEARHLKLFGMQDMVNYICAALIYGDQMQKNSTVTALLEKVKRKEINLKEALEQFP